MDADDILHSCKKNFMYMLKDDPIPSINCIVTFLKDYEETMGSTQQDARTYKSIYQ